MSLRIVRNPTVANWIVDLHRVFAAWLTDHYKLQHNMTVYLHPTTQLVTSQGLACGYFVSGRRPTIVLACRPPSKTFYTCLHDLLDTFAHEWCEYEKWRDHKPGNHRGLQQRVDALIRQFYNYLRSQHES